MTSTTCSRPVDRQADPDRWFYCTEFFLSVEKEVLIFRFLSFRNCVPEVTDFFAGKAAPGVKESHCFEGIYCLPLQAFINPTILNG
jgi:hypothetical protein